MSEQLDKPKEPSGSKEPRKGFSAATRELLKRRQLKTCIACSGTGINSNGGLCYPCSLDPSICTKKEVIDE